ncbi:hypothetical protein ABH994_002708 [Bradyrhizobium yuanmingense]
MSLDAAHEIEIGGCRLDGRIDVDAVGAVELRIEMALEAADEIGGDKRIDARGRGFRDEMAEAWQRHAGRTALIDQRRHAGLHAHHVGVHAETAGDILIDMGVGVDQPGQHQLAADIDDLLRAGRQNVGCDRRDLAIADGDVLEGHRCRRRDRSRGHPGAEDRSWQ